MRALVALSLIGCGGKDLGTVPDKPTDTAPPPVTDTDDIAAPWLSGGCSAQDDNALRYNCVFNLSAQDSLQLSLDGPGRDQLYASDAVTDRHELTLYLLTPSTEFTWIASAGGHQLAGTLTTGPLPPDVDIVADVTGVGTADTIVVPFQCGAPGHLVAVDERGQVEWYQNMTRNLGDGLNGINIDGFDASAESLIGLLGHAGIAEYAWEGEQLGSALVGQDYDKPTHHSVFRRDGQRFVLNADDYVEPDGTYVMDGIYVFDADWNVVDEWALRDILAPSGGGAPGGYWGSVFPGAVDYSHSNGIYVGDTSEWIVSMRGLHTVIGVQGASAAPDFGSLQWALTTSGFSPFTTDYLVTSSNGATADPSFSDQHHAHIEDDGGLWLFDNGNFGQDSRALRMTLRDDYDVADIDQVFQLDELCAVQSSVYLLPNAHVLVTCAGTQTIYEFDGASPEPIWEVKLSCAQGGNAPLMVRGQPIFW